jgi:hypothetical protein
MLWNLANLSEQQSTSKMYLPEPIKNQINTFVYFRLRNWCSMYDRHHNDNKTLMSGISTASPFNDSFIASYGKRPVYTVQVVTPVWATSPCSTGASSLELL